MAGHNKWSKIKHVKARLDKVRGKVFTRLIRELTVAARMGGGDPDANPRLRLAVQTARAENMPKDNIEKAIKKGTGELESENLEELAYEGYGPGGCAIYVEVLSENRNRSAAEIRTTFKKNGGNLGESGSVAWMFQRIGEIIFKSDSFDEDALMEAALEAGALDFEVDEDGQGSVTTEPGELFSVQESLSKAGFECAKAGLTRKPENMVQVEEKDQAEKIVKLLTAIEDLDDVQDVFTNVDFGDLELG